MKFLRVLLYMCLHAVFYHPISSAPIEYDTSLTIPESQYVVLSGPLKVSYRLDSRIIQSLYISLYKQGSSQPIQQIAVPQDYPEAVVRIACGVVDVPDTYTLKLHDSYSYEYSTLDIEAVWPGFNMLLPSTHVAQEDVTSRVQITYKNDNVKCSGVASAAAFIEVLYSENLQFTQPVIIHREENLLLKRQTITFPCEIFDRAGYVKVVFKSTQLNDEISESNPMSVTWGDYYRVSSAQSSVFPCIDKIFIQYTRPPCGVRDDNIHMYAAKPSETAGERELEYLYEAKAQVGHNSTAFECAGINQYQWRNNVQYFCFRYQSVAVNTAVTSHQDYCIPSNDTVGLPIDGVWSSWQEWSECTGKCEWGRQSRVRYCNNPSPANGGRFCAGETIEWRQCQSNCETVKVTPETRIDHTVKPGGGPTCPCGCNMSLPMGVIIPGTSCPSSGRYKMRSTWTITAAQKFTIMLNITDFKWTLAGQVLKVRDGSSVYDKILLDIRGDRHSENQFVKSSKSSLHIEFASYHDVPRSPALFYAEYSFADKEISTPAPIILDETEDPAWRLPVIIAGAIGGFLMVVCIVGVCAYKQISKGAKSPKPNKTKSVLEQTAGSPNHVAIQCQDGEYTNFGDVTIAPSVQATTTPKHKTKPAKKPKKSRVALPDPYHVKPEDFIHEVDVLHVPPPEPKHLRKSRSKQESHRHKKHTRRRHREKKEENEIDRLINSLPVGADHRNHRTRQDIDCWPTWDPDISVLDQDEYRALINQLSATSGSAEHAEPINTSAEIHNVPHPTPVDSSLTQELSSPVASSGGHRSPYMDDGYNSLANTGSTQSNISSRARDPMELPRLNLIKERSTKSENSSEMSPKSTPKSDPSLNKTLLNGDRLPDRPLNQPDGASDSETQSCCEPTTNVGSDNSSGPPPPPDRFSDSYVINNKSYLSQEDYSDVPPAVGEHNSSNSTNWPTPPENMPFLY